MDGIRAQLKSVIPQQVWPVMRWCDQWVIYLFYVFAWLKRLLFYPEVPVPPVDRSVVKIREYVCRIPMAQSGGNNLADELFRHGIMTSEGRHSVYIARHEDLKHLFPGLVDDFPVRVGLKIVRSTEKAPDGSPYYTSNKIAPSSTWFSMRAVGSALEKMVISNLLSAEGVAPQVYATVKLQFNGAVFYGFVVEHIKGEILHGPLADKFMQSFRDVCNDLGIAPISIKEHKDLRSPEFNDNIIADEEAAIKYVDIQNFTLTSKSLLTIVKNAQDKQLKHYSDAIYALMKNVYKTLELNRQVPEYIVVISCSPIVHSVAALAVFDSWCTILTPANGDICEVKRALFLYGFGRFSVHDVHNFDYVDAELAPQNIVHSDLIILDDSIDLNMRNQLTELTGATHKRVEYMDENERGSLQFFARK